MLRKILIAVVVLLVLVQFIRPAKNNGAAYGQQDITQAARVPDSVMRILKNSCYDCHSNKTNYPWYSQINPLGLWLQHHVDEGKRELNFTEFASYPAKKKAHKMEEIAETVEKGEMPMSSYTLVHRNAVLDTAQKKALINWARQQQHLIEKSL